MVDKSLPTEWMMREDMKVGDIKEMLVDLRSLRQGEAVQIIGVDARSVTVESIMTGHVEKVGFEHLAEF